MVAIRRLMTEHGRGMERDPELAGTTTAEQLAQQQAEVEAATPAGSRPPIPGAG